MSGRTERVTLFLPALPLPVVASVSREETVPQPETPVFKKDK